VNRAVPAAHMTLASRLLTVLCPQCGGSGIAGLAEIRGTTRIRYEPTGECPLCSSIRSADKMISAGKYELARSVLWKVLGGPGLGLMFPLFECFEDFKYQAETESIDAAMSLSEFVLSLPGSRWAQLLLIEACCRERGIAEVLESPLLLDFLKAELRRSTKKWWQFWK